MSSLIRTVSRARSMADASGGPQAASNDAKGDCTGRWLVTALVMEGEVGPEADSLPNMPHEVDLTKVLRPVFAGLPADEVERGVKRFVRHNDGRRFDRAWNTLFGMARRSERALREHQQHRQRYSQAA